MDRGLNCKVNGKSNETTSTNSKSGEKDLLSETFSPGLLLEEILNEKKLVCQIGCLF